MSPPVLPVLSALESAVSWALARPLRVYIALLVLSLLANLRTLMPLPFETSQIDYPKFIYRGHVIINGLSEGRFNLPDFSEYPLRHCSTLWSTYRSTKVPNG